MDNSHSLDARAMCKYGDNCYQKNPMHHEKFRHPDSPDKNGAKPEEKNGKHSPDSKKTSVDSKPEEKNGKNSPNPEISETSGDTKPDETNGKHSPEKAVTPEKRKSPAKTGDEPDSKKAKIDEYDGELLPPTSPKDVKAKIRQKFLMSDMPEDFYEFWKFCKEKNSEKPEEALLKTTGLKLVGPFDVLAGNISSAKSVRQDDYLTHYRYYYDVPEFQTIIADTKSDFHIGYFRDDPKTLPAFVASNDPRDGCRLTQLGDNLFGAVYNHLAQMIKKAEPFQQTALQKLKEAVHVYATMKVPDQDFVLDVKTRKMKSRDKDKVASVFHGCGLVVPYNKDTQVGYREIPETTASLKKILKNVVEAETDSKLDKAMDVLQELITNVQFANDEGDPGMGIELGLDAFCFGGSKLHSSILHLLSVGYELTGREAYAKIVRAHLKRREEGKVFKIQ